MKRLAKKFNSLVGKTKNEIISKFGNTYVYSENVLYYTFNRTWFTKGITLSVKFDRNDKVKKIDILENDKAILPYIFSLSDSSNSYKMMDHAQQTGKGW
ncbi:hypothetical protein [Chryseobacterium gwangjuense]|uniref:hypothetical protein n=1 Tax=Chryseobacterium gwangjuense TaxID=1069980 RepID=UPI001E2AEA99|nr:hypothetical protein [Chryseobacterium gwangjuense]MCE3075808.1 hypothetical protein [Chryseobacterium gwangjuense]